MRAAFAFILLALLGGSGCNGLLDVDNPANVKEDDLDDPTAAPAIVNGALSELASAYASFLMDNGAASDEFTFTGSRDAWFQIDMGNWSDPNNEFSDATFPLVARARWWSDEAIGRLEAFRADGKLINPTDLARAYLIAAVTYTMIADHYDDFVIGSDRQKCATPGVPACAPVGETRMAELYDRAIAYIDRGLELARASGSNAALELQLMAMRARAGFQKGIWTRINPRGTIAADPLVSSPSAAADAAAVLARTSDVDWRFALAYSATTQASSTGAWVNARLEFRMGDPYIEPSANGRDFGRTTITDLIDAATVSPIVDRIAREFDHAGLYPPAVIVSAREMHLILAESRLAEGDLSGFAEHVNALRGADGLSAWTGHAGQPTARAMLVHMRQTNLFLQGRRLHDHYRFRIPSVDWAARSEAILMPGTYFPITRIERDANPNVPR